MFDRTKNLSLPTGLIVADYERLQSKLIDFELTGASRLHVVFDFDRTLTVRNPGSDDEVTTWHILQEHLPQSGRREYQTLFDTYRPLELSGLMTQEDATRWWSSILDIFVQYRIDLMAVEEDFLSKANIRPGVKELFAFCEANNIPTVILSAGIRDVIEIWCRAYGIQPSLVLSTTLILDKGHKITEWERDTLVHVLNKSEVGHPELQTIRAACPKTLVVGDGLDDAGMVSGEQGVIRVRILDPRGDEVSHERERQRTFEKFDALIQSGSLQPLYELTKAIA